MLYKQHNSSSEYLVGVLNSKTKNFGLPKNYYNIWTYIAIFLALLLLESNLEQAQFLLIVIKK